MQPPQGHQSVGGQIRKSITRFGFRIPTCNMIATSSILFVFYGKECSMQNLGNVMLWLGKWSQSVQSLSRVRLLSTPWTAAHQASLSITNSRGVYSNSCPSSQWCHPTISSSVIPFSSCLQSFPVSGSFPVSQFFASGGQSIGISASVSVLPMNIQDWFPLGLISFREIKYPQIKFGARNH